VFIQANYIQMNSIQKFRAAGNNKDRIIYTLYSLGALFFFGIAIFTGLRLLTHASLNTDTAALVFIVTGLYILLQGIVAYGLFYCQKWIRTIFIVHILCSLITFAVVMPFFQLNSFILNSLISSLLYWVLLLFTFTTSRYCTGTYLHLVFVPLYGFLLSLFIGLRLYTLLV